MSFAINGFMFALGATFGVVIMAILKAGDER